MPEAVHSIVASNRWTGGVNSLIDPVLVPDNQVQWSVNQLNRGGVYGTRPGYCINYDAIERFVEARGFTIFKPKGKSAFMVKAAGTAIRISQYPFTTWSTLSGVTLDPWDGPVYFETGVKGLNTEDDGTLTVVESRPVLIIQTGVTGAWIWDGDVVTRPNAATGGTPVGTWMKWIGDRLWLAAGNKLFASNLLAPDQFLNDGSQLAGAGFFSFPDDITGMGVTPDQNSLLVFTDETTSAVQANILDRSTWLSTPDFKKIILPNIGCVAGLTIVSQWGMLWWLSQGGFIGLDDALTSFRSSRIHYTDGEMSRSKANMSDDISRACAGAFENFIMLSVPSGDLYNSHTWIFDQGIIQGANAESPSAWASCWIGTFPVQWATKMIHGKQRCFHLSRGHFSLQADNEPCSDLFESFTSLRKDISRTIFGVQQVKEIAWQTETKFLSEDARFKEFAFIEANLIEIAREATVDLAYASRHSGYKNVMSKEIVADVDNIGPETQVDFNSRIKQTRRVRSVGDVARIADNDPVNEDGEKVAIEDPNTRNKDRGFFVLISGQGEAAIENITLACLSAGDAIQGRVEADETTLRYVNPDGSGLISEDPPQDPTFDQLPQTTVPLIISPRNVEMTYSTL